jgi:uncharacterized protein with GYD domain
MKIITKKFYQINYEDFNSKIYQFVIGVKVLSVFVVLGNWTEQGIRNIRDVPKRAKLVNEMVKKAGGKMQTFYTLGKYDFVAIIEVPEDDDIMAILLCLGSMGNIRTTTMKAWTEADTANIITKPHP